MANGFKFSLEKLLEMRKTREEEGKKLFNNSQQELQKSINKLNDLNDKYKQYNGIAAGETVIYQKLKKNYLIALKQKEVDYRREQLKVRQIERKTVDILREKRFNQFMADEKRKEEIANDEFALYAHMRKIGKEVKEHGFR